MKTVLNIKENKSLKTFPLLARNLSTEIVVLFTSEHAGCLLSAGNQESYTENEIGYYDERWVSCFSKEWEIFKEGDSITITQEDNSKSKRKTLTGNELIEKFGLAEVKNWYNVHIGKTTTFGKYAHIQDGKLNGVINTSHYGGVHAEHVLKAIKRIDPDWKLLED